MNDIQWKLLLINGIVLSIFIAFSMLLNKAIPQRKKWLFPLAMPVLFLIGIRFFSNVLQNKSELDLSSVSAAFEWVGLSGSMIEYILYSVFFMFLFITGKGLYALLVSLTKKFPEAFYGRTFDTGIFELKPEYDIFNIFFKILFWISLIVSLAYNYLFYRLDILLALLNMFTLLTFELMILFPQKTTKFKEKSLLKNPENLEDEEYKNKEEFEKFLKYIKEEYKESEKLNATGKLRELE